MGGPGAASDPLVVLRPQGSESPKGKAPWRSPSSHSELKPEGGKEWVHRLRVTERASSRRPLLGCEGWRVAWQAWGAGRSCVPAPPPPNAQPGPVSQGALRPSTCRV